MMYCTTCGVISRALQGSPCACGSNQWRGTTLPMPPTAVNPLPVFGKYENLTAPPMPPVKEYVAPHTQLDRIEAVLLRIEALLTPPLPNPNPVTYVINATIPSGGEINVGTVKDQFQRLVDSHNAAKTMLPRRG